MNKFLLGLLSISTVAFAQEPVNYLMEYHPGDDFLTVSIRLPEDAREKTATLIIPRSAPGTYSLTDYSEFVKDVRGTDTEGEVIEGERGEGSYFTVAADGREITGINYRVEIRRMESVLTAGSETSKVRENYLGLLGYSVFGFADGLADRPVRLDVRASADWPIFSTLSPQSEPPSGRAEFTAGSFAELADAQYLLGRDLQIAEVDDAPVPLFVAVYSEVETDLDEIGRRALLSLGRCCHWMAWPGTSVMCPCPITPSSSSMSCPRRRSITTDSGWSI